MHHSLDEPGRQGKISKGASETIKGNLRRWGVNPSEDYDEDWKSPYNFVERAKERQYQLEQEKQKLEEASRAMLDAQEQKVEPRLPSGDLTPRSLTPETPSSPASTTPKAEVTPAPAPTPAPKPDASSSSSGTISQDNLPQKGPTVERANQAAPQKQSSVETPSQSPPKEASSAAFNRAMNSAALGDKHFKTTAVA